MVVKSFQAGLLLLLLSTLFVIASETNEKQVETERSGYWTYYCINYEEKRECNIARKINIEEQNETFLIIYQEKGLGANQRITLCQEEIRLWEQYMIGFRTG